MEVWIARHGQTLGNKTKIIQGHQGGELSEVGFTQAEKLGERLKNTKFQAIFISDLNRTCQTALPVLRKNKHRSTLVYLSPLLREKGGGVIEGMPLTTSQTMAKEQGIPLRKFKAEGGESWEDVHHRASECVDSLLMGYVTRENSCDMNATKRFSNMDEALAEMELESVIQGHHDEEEEEEKKSGETSKTRKTAATGKPKTSEKLRVLIISHGKGYTRLIIRYSEFWDSLKFRWIHDGNKECCSTKKKSTLQTAKCCKKYFNLCVPPQSFRQHQVH